MKSCVGFDCFTWHLHNAGDWTCKWVWKSKFLKTVPSSSLCKLQYGTFLKRWHHAHSKYMFSRASIPKTICRLPVMCSGGHTYKFSPAKSVFTAPLKQADTLFTFTRHTHICQLRVLKALWVYNCVCVWTQTRCVFLQCNITIHWPDMRNAAFYLF